MSGLITSKQWAAFTVGVAYSYLAFLLWQEPGLTGGFAGALVIVFLELVVERRWVNDSQA